MFYLKQLGVLEGYSRGYLEKHALKGKSVDDFVRFFFSSEDPEFIIVAMADPLTYVVAGGFPKGDRKVGLFYRLPYYEYEKGTVPLQRLLTMSASTMFILRKDGRYTVSPICDGIDSRPFAETHLLYYGNITAETEGDLRFPYSPTSVFALLVPTERGVYDIYEGRRGYESDFSDMPNYVGKLNITNRPLQAKCYSPVPVHDRLPDMPLLYYPSEGHLVGLCDMLSTDLPPYYLRFYGRGNRHGELFS